MVNLARVSITLQIRVIEPQTGGTDPVAEFGTGMRADVIFQLVPAAFFIPDFVAIRADGKDPLEGFDSGQS